MRSIANIWLKLNPIVHGGSEVALKHGWVNLRPIAIKSKPQKLVT